MIVGATTSPVFTTVDKQRLDLLAGVRGDSNSAQAAVLRSNLSALALLGSSSVTTLASDATVTPADYNTLAAEHLALWQAIIQIVAAINP